MHSALHHWDDSVINYNYKIIKINIACKYDDNL